MRIIEPSVSIIEEHDPLLKIELCGRVCYKSEDKIAPGSAEALIKKRFLGGHESVLEHFQISISADIGAEVRPMSYVYDVISRHYRHFRLSVVDGVPEISGNVRAWRDYLNRKTHCSFGICANGFDGVLIGSILKRDYPVLFGDIMVSDEAAGVSPSYVSKESPDYFTAKFICDRGVSHELVRHRVFSFSQESTRYCNYGDGNMIYIRPVPFDWAYEPKDGEKSKPYSPHDLWLMSLNHAEHCYAGMIAQGLPPQAARAVLPNSLKTEVLMTGTYHQWTEFFKLRLPTSAHPQMRYLARQLFELPQIPESIKNNEDLKKLL